MEERIETRIGAQIGMLSNLLSRQTACMSRTCGDESITRMQAIIIHYLLCLLYTSAARADTHRGPP